MSTHPSNSIVDNLVRRVEAPAVFRGFRVTSVELKNFGTYHGPATRFDLDCAGSIFAGHNGSGKSTAFDAFKLCFATSPKLNNASGDTERSDRSINTYYLGIYGDHENTSGRASKKTLRGYGNPEDFMAILVNFKDSLGNLFSAARLLYIDANQKRNWHYITGRHELSIERDFPEWLTPSLMRKRATGGGLVTHQSFDVFMGEVAKTFGLKDSKRAQRAFKLQAIAASLQVMGSTTNFVRDYMLPDDNFMETAEETVSVIQSHGKTRAAISETEAKLEKLGRICDRLQDLEGAFRDENLAISAQRQISTVSNYVDLVLARYRLSLKRKKIAEEEAKLEKLDSHLETTRRRLTVVEDILSKKDIGRIDDLTKEVEQKTNERDRRQNLQSDILSYATGSGLAGASRDPSGWSMIEKHLDAGPELKKRKETAQEERDEAQFAVRNASEKVDEIERCIQEAKDSGSPIRASLRKPRDMIAANLGLSSADLPFLGELLQVSDKWRLNWEESANRVLGAQATRILVPEAHYESALGSMEALDRNSFSERIRIEKMTAHHLDPLKERKAKQEIRSHGDRILAGRIEIDESHPFAAWAWQILARHADHKCVASHEFHKVSGRAVSEKGSISHSATSAERDGSAKANSRSNYVLGWSLEDRIKALEEEKASANTKLIELQNTLNIAEAVLMVAGDHVSNHDLLCRFYEPWNQVDTSHHQVRIDDIQAELKRLDDGEIGPLRDERETLKSKLSGLEKNRDSQAETVWTKKGEIESSQEGVEMAKSSLDRARQSSQDPLNRTDYIRIRKSVLQATATTPKGEYHPFAEAFLIYDYHDPSKVFIDLTSDIKQEVLRLTARRNRIGENIQKELIGSYFQTFDGEHSQGLSSDVRSNDESGRIERDAWRKREQEIRDKDLPAAKEAAEKFQQNTLMSNVMTMRSTLINYDKEARRTIKGINKILAENVYNPRTGSYAQIDLHSSANKFIQEFDGLISAALDGSTDMSLDQQFDRLDAIADFLKDDKSRRQDERRKNLAMLSGRFSATIREIKVEDDGTRTLLRKIDSSAALSGGEKERFSAFLMGVAVNCAFNAHDEMVQHKCLHTMFIDEAFGRSDGETTKAAIAVLNAFNLQVVAATPMAKIRPFQPIANTVYFISRPGDKQTQISRMQISDIDFDGDSGNDDDLEHFDATGL